MYYLKVSDTLAMLQDNDVTLAAKQALRHFLANTDQITNLGICGQNDAPAVAVEDVLCWPVSS